MGDSDLNKTFLSNGSTIKKSNIDSVIKVSKDFIESSSIIVKFGFLLLILIIFVSLLRIGTSFLVWLYTPSNNPILLKGLNNAIQYHRIPQNPLLQNSIPILRSNNEKQGMEFTWSIWMYIDNPKFNNDQYKHVFHKGNDHNDGGKSSPINAPGLYIRPHGKTLSNDLEIVMNTFDKIDDNIIIKDIPINKWINVIIRLNNQKQLDVYINGVLTKRHALTGVAKQTYGDVYATMYGGFSGYISELRYFDNAIGLGKINEIIQKGPNLKIYSSGTENNIARSKPQYLSTKWYFKKDDI